MLFRSLYMGNGAMAFCTALEEINLPSIKIIEKNAFQYCYELTKIIVGNSLERIGEAAFENCKKLKSIRLPDDTMRIENSAFESSGIRDIVLPSMISNVEKRTFACTPLESVVFTNCHVAIAEEAFFECERLGNIDWNRIYSIGEFSFRGCSFTSIHLKHISQIPRSAFANNNNLEIVEFFQANIQLGDEAFWGDFQLQNISSRCITSIGTRALAYTDVRNLCFDNLSRIGEEAFIGCKNLKNVFIKCTADNLVIERKIFAECAALQQVWIFSDSYVDVELDAFPNIGYSVYVLSDSELSKWAKNNSITNVVSVTREVMERKWREWHRSSL